MRLKRFQAPRMVEAMALVRAALGEEAIILASRPVPGGFEVTAAVEPDEPVLILPGASAEACQPSPPAVDPVLAFHGLPPDLALRLGDGGAAALAEALRFAPLPDGAARPLLLAGPPGAGKTLTIAKLAARAVLAGRTPVVVTTDGQRAGATEQLAVFTRVLGLTLAVAPGPSALAKALADRTPGEPALIDTAGLDPFDPGPAALLHALARAARAEVALVLPAGLDPAEAADLARAFAALGAAHLAPTRLDLARRLGGVLAAADAAGLPLAEAGTGPGVADGLDLLTPALLAARLRAHRPAPATARAPTGCPA